MLKLDLSPETPWTSTYLSDHVSKVACALFRKQLMEMTIGF